MRIRQKEIFKCGTLAGAGGIGGLLARSHGYSGGNWSSHNFYHADGNGNVTALVNSGGAWQASYKYDPFGRYLSGGGALASANVLRFSSKPWVGFAGSTTSGLYAYGYRFYDPYLQRWVNRDPLGEKADRNLYRFAACNPLRYYDPYGLDLISIPGGPPIIPFPQIPQPPPLQLPTPPSPPSVNIPPPCAPYPECLVNQNNSWREVFDVCLEECHDQNKCGLPQPATYLATIIGLGLNAAKIPATSGGAVVAAVFAGPGVWNAFTYIGCLERCSLKVIYWQLFP